MTVSALLVENVKRLPMAMALVKPETSKVLPVLLLPETKGVPTDVVPSWVR